jgi:uncharacterized protein (DUF2147 family)
MANKKIVFIALILMAIAAGSAFAADFKEGYHRASNGYVLVLMHNGGNSWSVRYLDDNGKTRGDSWYEGTSNGSRINFKAYGSNYYISIRGNNVYDSYGDRTYTWYKGL